MNLRSVIKGVALAATAAGVGYAALRTADGERLDRALFEAGNTDAGPGADRFFLGVTELGSLYAAAAAAGVLAVSGRPREGVRALSAAGATWLLGQGLKKAVNRPRPYEADAEANPVPDRPTTRDLLAQQSSRGRDRVHVRGREGTGDRRARQRRADLGERIGGGLPRLRRRALPLRRGERVPAGSRGRGAVATLTVRTCP